MASMMSAAASSTCSQLSTTTNVSLDDADIATVSTVGLGTPKARANVGSTSPSSLVSARSTNTTRAKAELSSSAAAMAARVLPMPPMPMSVTS